ncbi:unnamed protein product [Symbiodinium sp. KB8]|nr:unnamed protein product [Symbiodinium sp. KB8]
MLKHDIRAVSKSIATRLALWDRLPHYAEHFCDVSLRSTDGRIFKAHRLVLSMASDPLFAMLSGSFAEGQQSEVPFDYSGEALNAFLEFLYRGTFCVKKAILPELLRLVHQWEVQPLQAALNDLLVKHMTPELCSSLIVDCEVLLVDKLDEMLEGYVLENFGSCVRTEQFGSWPLHRMIGILRSDDLVAEHEEEVLAAVMHWHRSGPGRDDATAALLQMVRFPLLSVAALQGLGSREGLTGLPGVVMSRLAAAALKVHQGCPQSDCQRWDRPDSHDEQASFMKTVKLRNAYPYWWADFGCSLRGGGVVAERSGIDTEGELEPWAVHIHDQSLYIIDGREPCCVLQVLSNVRSCGNSFFQGDLVAADLLSGLYSSLKGSVLELSESLRCVIDNPKDEAVAHAQAEPVRVRPILPREVPRSLAFCFPQGLPTRLVAELETQIHLATSPHVLFPSLFNFASGFDGGVTSFAVLQLTDPTLVGGLLMPLSAWDIGAVVSSRVCGALCGSMLLLCTSKEPSSRDILVWTAVGLTAISLGTFFVADRNTLLALRFLSGLTEGLSSPAKAAYVVETVEAELRGPSNGSRWAAFALGSCAGVAAGAVLQPIPGAWQLMFGAVAVPSVIAGIGMASLPHSPRWLVHGSDAASAERRSLALESLQTLRPCVDPNERQLELQKELDIICQGMRGDKEEPVPLNVRELFQHPATEINALLTCFKQANGTVCLTTYLAPVMAAMGFQNHLTTLGVVLMTVRSVATPMGIVLMDRLGRRGSLLLGCLGSSVSMSTLLLSHILGSHASTGLMTLSFTSLAASAAIFELCWAPTSFQLTTELYPQRLRQHGLALSHVFNYAVKALEMQVFPMALALAGLTPVFTVFAVVNAAGSLVVYHTVPETCGRSLEEGPTCPLPWAKDAVDPVKGLRMKARMGGMVYNPLWNDRGEKAAAVLRDALIRRDPGSMELALQELANARSLKLDLQSRRLGDAGASKLAEALQATRSLEELELNLGGNSISKKGAEVLATALAQLKTLRRLQLNLWENSLGDDGVSAFANTLGELIHLEKLEFELLENNIGGRGALALAAATSRLQSLQQLRLNLASNWISKATQAQMKVTVDSLQLTQRELYMLNGVNDFSDIIDIAIDAAGDLYVLDGQHGRIVRIRDGVGEVVGAGKLCLDVGTRALYIGADGSIYFIDENGSRVQRYFDGQTTSVAGRPESGSEASQLEDAEDIFVTREGVLYVSDSGNNRIQKWTPGATEGVTVAGGNGKGSRLDQLQHPVGLHITEDSTIYIADYQNHRIMKWREGWQHGLVVAGGQGNGDELYQAPQRVNRMGSSLLT